MAKASTAFTSFTVCFCKSWFFPSWGYPHKNSARNTPELGREWRKACACLGPDNSWGPPYLTGQVCTGEWQELVQAGAVKTGRGEIKTDFGMCQKPHISPNQLNGLKPWILCQDENKSRGAQFNTSIQRDHISECNTKTRDLKSWFWDRRGPISKVRNSILCTIRNEYIKSLKAPVYLKYQATEEAGHSCCKSNTFLSQNRPLPCFWMSQFYEHVTWMEKMSAEQWPRQKYTRQIPLGGKEGVNSALALHQKSSHQSSTPHVHSKLPTHPTIPLHESLLWPYCFLFSGWFCPWRYVTRKHLCIRCDWNLLLM